MWFVIGVTFTGKFFCLAAFESEVNALIRCEEISKDHFAACYYDDIYVKFIPFSNC